MKKDFDMILIDWTEKVAKDYRERILTDPDNTILAFKASRDRYKEGISFSYGC